MAARHHYLGGRMLDLQHPQNGGPVVGDRDITNIIHQHLQVAYANLADCKKVFLILIGDPIPIYLFH